MILANPVSNTEAVHNGVYDNVTLGRGQSGDKVHRNVGPGSPWDRQGMEEPSWCLVGGFAPHASGAGSDVLLGVCLERRPPEVSTEQGDGAVGCGMAGKARGM